MFLSLHFFKKFLVDRDLAVAWFTCFSLNKKLLDISQISFWFSGFWYSDLKDLWGTIYVNFYVAFWNILKGRNWVFFDGVGWGGLRWIFLLIDGSFRNPRWSPDISKGPSKSSRKSNTKKTPQSQKIKNR
jgi:hypothetical protein